MYTFEKPTLPAGTMTQADWKAFQNRQFKAKLVFGAEVLGAIIALVIVVIVARKLWRRIGGRAGALQALKSLPGWLLRDLRQAVTIACGVLVALMLWSLLR